MAKPKAPIAEETPDVTTEVVDPTEPLVTRFVPAGVELDYETTLDAEDFADPARGRRSHWIEKLETIAVDTAAGKIKTGADGLPRYVRVGFWKQKYGAQQCIRSFETTANRLPKGTWDFKKRMVTDTATNSTGSELWVRLLPADD